MCKTRKVYELHKIRTNCRPEVKLQTLWFMSNCSLSIKYFTKCMLPSLQASINIEIPFKEHWWVYFINDIYWHENNLHRQCIRTWSLSLLISKYLFNIPNSSNSLYWAYHEIFVEHNFLLKRIAFVIKRHRSVKRTTGEVDMNAGVVSGEQVSHLRSGGGTITSLISKLAASIMSTSPISRADELYS